MMTYSRSFDCNFSKTDNCSDSSKRDSNRASLLSIMNPASPPMQQQPSSTALPTMLKSNRTYPPWIKSFKCTVCPKSYNRKNSLQRHMRIHSGAKPYECDNCSKRFTRKDILEKHKESMKCQRIRKIHNQSIDMQQLEDSEHSSIIITSNRDQYSSPQAISETIQYTDQLPFSDTDYNINNNGNNHVSSSLLTSEAKEDTIPEHPLLGKDTRYKRESSPLRLPSNLFKF